MFKQEQGFSLVELAIAAGLAVALAATAVTVLSGTTATLSSKANGAAGTSTQYNYDVLNDGGTVNPTVDAPVAPAGVVAGNVTQTGATLTWDAVSGATSYVAFLNGEIAATLDAGTTSYDFTGLTAGTGYTLAVVAVNAGGNSTAAEAVVTTVVAAPVTPTGLTSGTVTKDSIALTWSNTSGATSYKVYKNGAFVADVSSASYTFTGLTSSTSYMLGVVAVNAGGSSATAKLTVVTPAPVITNSAVFSSSAFGGQDEWSFYAWGTVNYFGIWNGTQSGADALRLLKVGDQISYTVGGVTTTRTITEVSDRNDYFVLYVDSAWPANVDAASGGNMTSGTTQFKYFN